MPDEKNKNHNKKEKKTDISCDKGKFNFKLLKALSQVMLST